MKKLVLATALAALSTTAMANVAANNGYYVQGNVGVSKLEAKEDGDKFKKNQTGFTLAVGKDTGAVRYVGDYTYFGKIKNDVVVSPTDYHHAKLVAHSLGLSAIYDFDNQSAFTPYAGARLGVNVLKLDTNSRYNASYSSLDERKTNVGAGVLAGVQYAVNPNLAVDAGVEYNYLGKVGNDDVKVNQYGAKVGLRYNF
ncbi:opacity family porin [Moraxella marmotae]|uniref:opacity family porin n=1 Tax=Moraxella marmotae TaxID=3344520 RepID=UPI0035F27C9D